jgi:hypothetical protein
MGIAREMARLIRLSYNGHLPTEELTRYIFALDKTRVCLESAINLEAQAIANAPKPPPAPVTINVLSVPSGTHLDEAAMQKLHEDADNFKRTPLIEYLAAQEPTPEPAPEPEPTPDPTEDDDPLQRRAKELGFKLLPRRPARVD